MPARLWAYNYNFEFDFAHQKSISFGSVQKLPWWFLNRSSTLLIPLARHQDAILTYQLPQNILLQQFQDHFKNLPHFISIASESNESNCVFDDFRKTILINKFSKKYKLAPWGWSPCAIKLAKEYFKNTVAADFQEVISKANSKQTSDYIRSNLLPASFQIPSLQITKDDISLETLKNTIYRFISQNSQVKIKHYFGASGRLTNTISELSINPKKFSQWRSWIKQTGGILMEKELKIDAEYSIQAELDKNGSTKLLTLTRMFSNSNGSYLGNLISLAEQDTLIDLAESFKPLFSYLAEIKYQGPLGLDLIKTTTGELKLVEINARYTMGRIAYEWNSALNKQQFGFFANFFMKGSQTLDISIFLDFCHKLEKRLNCTISIINVIPSTQKPLSLITIFIGANTKINIIKSLNEIYPTLFHSIKL